MRIVSCTMKIPFLLFALSIICGFSYAESNSKGKKSPLVIGKITEISADGKTISILHQGEHNRTIVLPESGIQYVSVPANKQVVTVGYSAKASINGNSTKKLQLTLPIPEHAALGPERTSLTMEQILKKADSDSNQKIDYVEMSESLYHSPKHGPDKFVKFDKDKDGFLDVKELNQLMSEVGWWKYSRKTVDEWFTIADADNNGSVSKKEFLQICSGKNHIDNHFKRTDRNNNGVLEKNEVASYVSKSAGQHEGE